MTLATATIERFTTITSALTPVTETPVVRDPTADESSTFGPVFMLYVTRANAGGEDLVGTVAPVHSSNSRDGWLKELPNSGYVRVYGAVLNEPMVNGGHYRSLNGAGMYVRYNDDDHAGDRNVGALPLSILASNGNTWPVPNDGTGAWTENTPYIRVEAPATPDVPSAEDAPAEVMDAHQFVTDLTVNGPTRGFAALNSAGRAELNPALEVGETYLYWTTAGTWARDRITEARLVTGLPADGDPEFSILGYWTMERVRGEDQPYWYATRRTVLDESEGKSWVKMALTTMEATNTDRLTWDAIRLREIDEFAEFNSATNELAKDNDWCSEYEGIIEPLGMEGRTKTMHDYDVEVSASISFEVDSVSSRIDQNVASDYSASGISLNSARFRGDVTVTIRVSDVDDDDDASDQIDSDTVYEHINNMLSGHDDLEIDDYSIGSTRQVD